MRAAATASPAHKRNLLTSCALAASMAALAYGGPALAQVAGTGQAVSGPGLSIPTISPPGPGATNVDTSGAQTIINWTPTDPAATGGAIDFLPTGNTLNFSGTGDYTVLNRFVNGAGGTLSRQIALNGTVNSTNSAASGARGGNIWFYNAGGILIGATGVINVGSLILSANNIVTTGGLFGPGGTIRFDGTSGSTSAVTVNGNITTGNDFNPGSSYVALVAPRIVQAGTVRTDGSVAYVAAEQANIRINSGLFDIDVTVGAEGGNAITHTGTTTGPAHQQGDTDQSRIYMVAIPKNDAVTMLVSGAIGYDDALSAQVDPDGAVRLSAGYSIVGGEIAATPANATAANITAGDTLFRSNTVARASAAFVATPTQTLPASPSPLSSEGQFFVQGNGIFTGDASATVNIGAGQSGGATGTFTVQSGGRGGLPGSAAVNVTGGSLSAPGALTIQATGTPDAVTGDSQGGTASLTITGGSVTTSGVTVEANGTSDEGSGGTTGNGRGGNAGITVSGAGSSLTAGNIFINAVGRGDNSFVSGPPAINGSGTGGTASLTVANGGAVGPAALLNLDARGIGGIGLTQSGDGTGGTARVQVSGAGSFLSTTQSFVRAQGVGGGNVGPFRSQNGGDGTGGTAEIRINADAASTVALGSVGVFAIGTGGSASDSENTTGGDALGGTASLTVDGVVDAQFTDITLDASAAAGIALSPSGTTGRSGNARANSVTLAATNGSSISSSGQINLFAVGSNPYSDTPSPFGNPAGENLGTGTGGTIAVNATAGGTISSGARFTAEARGGSVSDAVKQSAGNGTGGDVDFLADGGTIRANTYNIDASGRTVNVTGTGGTAQGGTIDLFARNGGQMIATLDATSRLNASARTGASAAGTTATGGAIRLIANAGTINLSVDANLSADGVSGGATTAGAGSPAGLGGSVLIRVEADPTNASRISYGQLAASANGQTQSDFGAFPSLPAETGGTGRGGTMTVEIEGGTLSGGVTTLSADGISGDAAGSIGTGGTARFTQTGGTVDVSDMTVSASGNIVADQSGNGTGGTATIDLLGGTITAADIIARADGQGGTGSTGNDNDPLNIIPGGTGGTGRGGTATINIGGSAVVDASTVIANARGAGGAGGNFNNMSSFGGLPGTPGAGGDGFGGDARVNVSGGATTASALGADASGLGGTGGNSFLSSSSGSATGVGVGGRGGNGRGGNATVALAVPISGVSLAGSIARGTGGDGGAHNVGGNGGDGFGGVAQAIVTGFDAGQLAIGLDSTGIGGNGADGRDGNGGSGGNGTGGTSRMRAEGAGANLTVVETNFITGGIGGNGGAGGLGFGSFPAVAPSGGNGGNGQGGAIEVAAADGGAVSIGVVTGGSAVLDSSGRGGNGGAGANSVFGAGNQAGNGGDGGTGSGGGVRLIAAGGTIGSNGAAVAINASGVAGTGGIGGIGQGGGASGANGIAGTTAGGRAVIETAAGASGPGTIDLGLTSITANGDAAGRIEVRAAGAIRFAGLAAEALGSAAPTNNDTDTAPAGIFITPTGGAITSQGDVTLTTDSSIGVYGRSNGVFDVNGVLTISAGDQIDIRHDAREGTAPTIRASGNLIATAANSIGGAAGSLIGAGGALSLTVTGPAGTITIDRLAGNDITLNSIGATSVEHAEAVNDFTATAGSFRTGLNSIITGGDIDITSPGTVDLGNSSAGGFVSVDGQSITFNTIDAGSFVSLSANGTGATDGITGANITAGNAVILSGAGVSVSGTVQAGDSLFVTATQRDAAIGLANVAGNVSVNSAGNLSGIYRSGGNVNLRANGDITAEADATGGYTESSTGLVAEGYILADAGGDATLSNSSAATMIGVRGGGAAALTSATAGEDVFVLAGTTANLTGIIAGDDITVDAAGGITIADARTTGAGPVGRSVVYAPGASVPAPFLQIQNSAADLSNIMLLAPAAAIDAAGISAFDNLTATGGTITATGPLSAGANITLSSIGAIDLADSTAGGFVQISGQSIAFDTITAGATVGLSSDGTALGAEGIRGGSIAAGGDINLFANSIVLTGTVKGDASLFAFGTGGAVSVANADLDGTISIFSATDLSGSYVAGGNIFLNSSGNINASAQANGGYVDSNGIVAEGNLFVIAAGNAALTDSSAARMFGVNAGLAASVNGGTAGEDMLVLGGTTASLTGVTAGDDVTVRAPGNITALNVRTTGTGADTHVLGFSSAASSSPTFTISLGAGADGADIVMTSAAGAIGATTLAAGDDILLNAAGSIGLNGATTLGLGATGGDSSIRTQGGATTLAGLDAFSDVAVQAAGLANLSGTVVAGRDATINAQGVTLVTLTDPSGFAPPTLSADGNVVVASSAGITGGALRAGGDITLTAGTAIAVTEITGNNLALSGATGITADRVRSNGFNFGDTVSLNSSNGDIRIGDLSALASVDASANAIRIESGGPLRFTTLTTDVGDAYVHAGPGFTLANGNVAGNADFASSAESMDIASLTAANATIVNTSGDIALDTATVAGSLNTAARGSIGIAGVVTGRSISLASANIGIAATGRVGTAGTTQQLSIRNNNNGNQTFVGGTGTPSGYHIDANELTRLFGTQIEVFAPEVAAASGGSVGSAAPPDMVVDGFTLTGGAAGSNLGANGALTLRTAGKMRVIGSVQLTGLSDTNALNLVADDALEVILGQGSVRLLGAGNAPGGQLNMISDDVIVATQAAIAAVGAATTTEAINRRLGQNDGIILDEGALFARGIRADVNGGFYVQNSGAGTDFAQRRGFTFGAGGLDVVTGGAARIVINGVQLGPNGQITGLDAIPLLTIGGTAPATGRFDPRSTFNGCLIARSATCAVINLETGFPVQDVIEEETKVDEERDGNFLPQPLITIRDTDSLTGEPLLDDPVTGAGNDDLWTPPAE